MASAPSPRHAPAPEHHSHGLLGVRVPLVRQVDAAHEEGAAAAGSTHTGGWGLLGLLGFWKKVAA